MLVHGAWHGAWAWEAVAPLLTEQGFTVHTVDLPSSGDLGDLRADAAVVRAAASAIDEPVTLVGHSYGGMAITEASASLDNVDHLVYVAAFLLPEGLSVLQAVGGTPPPWWVIDADRRTVEVADPVAVFYHDCPPEVAGRVGKQSLDSFEQPLSGAGWTKIPSTYVLCEHDAAIPPFAQEEMAKAAGATVRMPTGHSPFFADPAGLTRHLAAIAATA